jgi:selenium metabolism protein YedF
VDVVDARGLACPIPVMRTKDALMKGEPLVVLVDDPIACENVSRFASTSGCAVEISQQQGQFELTITPGETTPDTNAAEEDRRQVPPRTEVGTVFLVTSDEIGHGERELGVRLMRMFLYTTAESGVIGTTVFMNSGVRLATEDEEAAASISRLVDRGWKVLVCGTCLDYYGLKDDLKAGTVSNMYEIHSALVGAANVVSL